MARRHNKPRNEMDSRAWRQLSHAILARDHHVCQIAGPHCTRVATTTDHIQARAEGGPVWDPTNLRAACRACNGEGGMQVARRQRARYTQRIPTP